MIGEIAADEAVVAIPRPGRLLHVRDPVLLQLDRIIIVEIVDADDRFAAREQAKGAVHADEAGRAGDEDCHNPS